MTDAENKERLDAILDAALGVFAEVGYTRATIKAIAARAGIKSPALIYWYFKNKEEVLRGVMSRFMPTIAPTADLDSLITLPLENLLRNVASGLISAYTHPMTGKIFRVFFSEMIHNPEVTSQIIGAGPILLLDLLRRALTHHIEIGTLRPHDVETSARAFIGMVIIYAIGRMILPPLGDGLPPPDPYIDEIVRLFIRGLAASPAES